MYRDGQFAALFPRRGRPAEAPGRLALAVVLQFVENLSDRDAADAVRGRIDWKYALGLALTDPGFDHTVLSEFRTRLVEGKAELLLFDVLLRRLREEGLVRARGRQRTDSTHVLAAMRGLNRLERVGETLRAALNELAAVAPAWLREVAPATWYERYGRRVENYRLPRGETARLALAAEIGADGEHLLAALDAAMDRPELTRLPMVQVLRQVWNAQFVVKEGRLRLGVAAELPASAEQVCSPYDPEARYSTKRDVAPPAALPPAASRTDRRAMGRLQVPADRDLRLELRAAAPHHQRRDDGRHDAGRQHGRGDPRQPGAAWAAAG